LIKDKVDRTIECCFEALHRARDKAGITLSDVDHVILVGGSSRIPLVRQTVTAAFCNLALPQRVKNPEPLLHEPDLCVAYGAALRAATYGTWFIFDFRLPIADWKTGSAVVPQSAIENQKSKIELELHVTSPPNTQNTTYKLT